MKNNPFSHRVGRFLRNMNRSAIMVVSGFVAVLCLFALLTLGIVAQTPEQAATPLTASPEVLERIARCEQLIADVSEPREKTIKLFQLLGFELRLSDKEPAKRTLGAILQTAATLNKEAEQNQLYEAVASALVDLGEVDQAVAAIQKISRPATLAEARLNLVEQILSANEAKNLNSSYDVTGLLKMSIAGALETKDAGLEALALTILGRELGKQGKMDEAKSVFREARGKAREIEDVQERTIVALIVRSEIQSGMTPEALALIETVASDDQKQAMYALAVSTLNEEINRPGKEGANDRTALLENMAKFLAQLQPGTLKDKVLGDFATASAGWISSEALAEMVGMLSTQDQKEPFLQEVCQTLATKDRLDVARELAKFSLNPEFELFLKVCQMEALFTGEKYAEAAQLIATLEDEQLKRVASRHLAFARIIKGDKSTDAMEKLEQTLSEDEKQEIVRINVEFDKIASLTDFDDRIEAYFDMMKLQFQLSDIKGVRKTMATLLQLLDKGTDPAKVVVNRLLISRVQTEFSDKEGAKDNLRRLLQVLENTKDLRALEGLVPEELRKPDGDGESQNATPDTPRVVLNMQTPVDLNDIRDQLFELYLAVADALTAVEDSAEAKKAVQKAFALAESDENPSERFKKLLLATQALAEIGKK